MNTSTTIKQLGATAQSPGKKAPAPSVIGGLLGLITPRWKVLIALGALAGGAYGVFGSTIPGWGVAISYAIAGALGTAVVGLFPVIGGSAESELEFGRTKRRNMFAGWDDDPQLTGSLTNYATHAGDDD